MSFNENTIKVTKYDCLGKLPNPFLFDNGEEVKSVNDWEKRRKEIYKTAVELQYGTMPPKPELLKGKGILGIDFEKLLKEINSKIEDKDRHIGHSYLINIENENDLKRAFKNKIIPLLNEYYYNDQDEVKNILNCCDEAKKVMEIVNK